MKTNKIWSLLAIAIATITLPSCLDDDDNMEVIVPNAVVTLKTSPSDGKFFIQLDDSTTLNPVNMQRSPYGEKEVRAFINFNEVNENSRMTSRDVHVNWVDSIRTKGMSTNMGIDNDRIYGADPLELVNDWTTVVEDGYLTIRFRTHFAYGAPSHYLYLTPNNNPENPYEVTLHHDAKGDVHGEIRDGVIAFRLDMLPDTNGETVDLIVNWNSYLGYKSAKFKYRTRN